MGRAHCAQHARALRALLLLLVITLQSVQPATHTTIAITGIACTLYEDGTACQQLCMSRGFGGPSRCIIELCHCYLSSTSSHASSSRASTSHSPTSRAPTSHSPTSHSPTSHSPTSHSPTSRAPTSTSRAPYTTPDPFADVEKLTCTTLLDATFCSEKCRAHGALSGQCVRAKCRCKRRSLVQDAEEESD